MHAQPAGIARLGRRRLTAGESLVGASFQPSGTDIDPAAHAEALTPGLAEMPPIESARYFTREVGPSSGLALSARLVESGASPGFGGQALDAQYLPAWMLHDESTEGESHTKDLVQDRHTHVASGDAGMLCMRMCMCVVVVIPIPYHRIPLLLEKELCICMYECM